MEQIGVDEISEHRDRVVILIDGGSLFRAATQLGIEVNYEKLLPCLLRGRNLIRAHFYTGYSPGNLKQAAFLKWMQNNGYRVLQKELTVNPDGSRRANLGVEIAIDMLQFVQANLTSLGKDSSIGVIVLVSHNSDLAYVAEKIATQGMQLEIVSLKSLVQETLLNYADRFIDLETIQDEIRKKPHSQDE
jgi:uncharacterized LabA/DUF88 family protein